MGDYLFYALATALVTFSLLAVSLPNLLHAAILQGCGLDLGSNYDNWN